MEKSNVKQRVINLSVYTSEGVLFEKKNCSPQDIISALALFERDGLKVVVSLDTIDISTGSPEHNIKQFYLTSKVRPPRGRAFSQAITAKMTQSQIASFSLLDMDKKSFEKPNLITVDFVDGSTGEIISHDSMRKCQLSRSDFYKYLDHFLDKLNEVPSLAIQFHVVPPILPLSLFDDSSGDDVLDDLECLKVAGTDCYILP